MLIKSIIKHLFYLFLFTYHSIAASQTEEYLRNKINRLTTDTSQTFYFEAINKEINKNSDLYTSIKRTVEVNCISEFKKQLSFHIKTMNEASSNKTDFKRTVRNLITFMEDDENAVMDCAENYGMQVKPTLISNEGEFSYPNWLETYVNTLEELDKMVSKREFQELLIKSQILNQLSVSCGKPYHYFVRGYCANIRVKGEIDACADNRKVHGTLKYSNYANTEFNGKWVGNGEIKGQDSLGNNCELEVD